MPSQKPIAQKPAAPKPAALKNVRNCQHIKVTGIPCGSPALRGEQFCYFHQRMLRGVKTPPNARLHPIALIEDEESIRASLMEVINALARNHIDLRRADLILKALYIASKNSHRARMHAYSPEMVRAVPDYPVPPKTAAPPIPQRAGSHPTRRRKRGPPGPGPNACNNSPARNRSASSSSSRLNQRNYKNSSQQTNDSK
jgi:hypothetical protein